MDPSAPVEEAPRGSRLLLGFLVLVVAALLFQGGRGVWRPDEGRYVEVALEMLRTGDWLTPRFNDEVLHFTKPPVTYWSVAASVAMFGRNELAVRLPGALALLATVLVVYALGRRTVGRRAWVAALVYGTFALPFAASNLVTTDTLLALWEALAVLGFALARFGAPRRRWGITLLWTALGAAFATKGPPGLLPLLGIVTFALLADGRRGLRPLLEPVGLAAFLALGFTWYVVMVAEYPFLLHKFLGDEVVGRVFSDEHGRNGEWYGAFTTYVPALLLGLLPWTWHVARALPRAWRAARCDAHPESLFLLVWPAVMLLVFALARSRMPLYVLPLCVPLALLVALHGNLGAAGDRRWLRWAGVWLLLMVAGKGVTGRIEHRRDGRALARSLAAQVDPLPAELCFLAHPSHYGLPLYLDCEVEEIVYDDGSELTDAPILSDAPPESLASELARDEPGRLFLVPKSSNVRFGEEVRRLGAAPVLVGEHGELDFYRLVPWTPPGDDAR